MAIIQRKIYPTVFLALAVSACGGDSEDSSFEKVGASSDTSNTSENSNLPPSLRNAPMIPGIRPPVATEPGLRSDNGSLYPRVASLTGQQQAAPAFIAPLLAHDINNRVLRVAGQRIAYDEATLFVDRSARSVQVGHVVQISAVPISADLWYASQVRFIAETATPGAMQLTLSGRVPSASLNSTLLNFVTPPVTFADAIPASLATPGAWLTIQGYDTGSGFFTATSVTAFGLDGANAGDSVFVSGPAYLDSDSSSLIVAGIRIRWFTSVNVDALQLDALTTGEWITVAGVVDDSLSFILGTELLR